METSGTATNGIYFQQKQKELVIVFNVFFCKTTSQQSFQSWTCLGAQMLQALFRMETPGEMDLKPPHGGHEVLSQHTADLVDRGAEVGNGGETKAWTLCRRRVSIVPSLMGSPSPINKSVSKPVTKLAT